MMPDVVKQIIEGAGLDYEYYETLRINEFDVDWAVIVLIKSKEDIERYKKMWEELTFSPSVLKDGIITFRVVGDIILERCD